MRRCSYCGKILGDSFVAERLEATEKFCSLVCFWRYYERFKADETKRAKMVG